MRTTRHRRTRRRLDAYVDAELAAGVVPDVERHLDECPDCRTTVVLIRRLKRSLARLARDDRTALERLRGWVAAELTGPRGDPR
ncbi:MAG: zf-HC2 domain-containing protein [Acidimicrobiales bacterium]